MAARLVLDASAFVGIEDLQGDFLSTPMVMDELRSQQARVLAQSLIDSGRLLVTVPEKLSVEKVRKAAKETGDLPKLSPADVEVLALASERGTLVTDDYALQNVALHMGVPFQPMAAPGIKEKRMRKRR
jgi:UPF0271 protein